MKGRFKNIGTNLLYNTQVAEVNGNIAGMIGMNLGYHYEKNGNYIRIVALVVDQNYRRQGIGERLIQTAEEWAREKGATKLVLNSGNRDERSDAQQFYKDRVLKERQRVSTRILFSGVWLQCCCVRLQC